MTDIKERGKIGLLIIAHQYSNNKPFHSQNTPFFGYNTRPTRSLSTQVRELDNVIKHSVQIANLRGILSAKSYSICNT